MACLFHQAERGHWGRDPIELATTIAAVFIICRPRSVAAFLSLSVLELATIFDQMPEVSNHWLFSGIVSATIAAAALVVWLRDRSGPIRPGQLYEAFAPLARLELVLFYFFVVFHKLNTDFLSVDVSCGASHYRHLVGLLPWLPGGVWAQEASIWATLGVETAIPLMLIFSRTRTLGVLLGALFHFFLGINHFFDFSAMLYASFLLFAPENMTARLAERWSTSRPGRLLARLPGWLMAVALFLLWAAATGNSFADPFVRFGPLWEIYGLLWIGGFGWAVATRGLVQPAARRLFKPVHPALLLLPLALLANGMSPYLGLKTGSSFAMFSNLRTEAGRSNHLIIPSGALELWSYQTDLVTVLRSSDPELAKVARRHRPIPYFTLRALVSQADRRGAHDIELTYVRNGSRRTLTQAELDPELSRPHGLLARKFFHFRAIQTAEKESCDH